MFEPPTPHRAYCQRNNHLESQSKLSRYSYLFSLTFCVRFCDTLLKLREQNFYRTDVNQFFGEVHFEKKSSQQFEGDFWLQLELYI